MRHISIKRLSLGVFGAALVAGTLAAAAPSRALAAEEMTYLFPAPAFLPAFSPFQLALHKGYYKGEGLDVKFSVGKGGVDVAKQVGVGNAALGGGIGDTPVIVRPNGVPVKSVAVLGGQSLTQIYVRKDSGIKTLDQLKDKTVAVMSYQDTTFYSLLGVLARHGMARTDVKAQAVGPGGVIKLMISGDAQAMSGVPEWAAAVQGAGVPVDVYSVNEFFPGMAQAIIASDDTIKSKPNVVRGFVKGTLKALAEVMKDPATAAREYVSFVPQHKGKEKMIEGIMRDYTARIYSGQAVLGAMDAKKLAALQDFYLAQGIIRSKTAIDDLYTNEFVQ